MQWQNILSQNRILLVVLGECGDKTLVKGTKKICIEKYVFTLLFPQYEHANGDTGHISIDFRLPSLRCFFYLAVTVHVICFSFLKREAFLLSWCFNFALLLIGSLRPSVEMSQVFWQIFVLKKCYQWLPPFVCEPDLWNYFRHKFFTLYLSGREGMNFSPFKMCLSKAFLIDVLKSYSSLFWLELRMSFLEL